MTCIQHQIDASREEIEKNAAENSKFKKITKKKINWGKVHKRDEVEILYKKFFEKEFSALKMRLKPTSSNRNANHRRSM